MENSDKPKVVHSSYCDLGLQNFYSAEKFFYETAAPNHSSNHAAAHATVDGEQKSTKNVMPTEVLSSQELSHRVQRIASNSVRPVIVDGKLFFVPCGEDVDVVTAAARSDSQASLISEVTAISSADELANVKSVLKLLANLKTYLGDANYARFLDYSKGALAINGDETCESLLLKDLHAFTNGDNAPHVRPFNSVDDSALATSDIVTVQRSASTMTAAEKESAKDLRTAVKVNSHHNSDVRTARFDDLLTVHESPSDAHVDAGDLRTAIEVASGDSAAADGFDDLLTAHESSSDAHVDAGDLHTAIEVASGDSAAAGGADDQ